MISNIDLDAYFKRIGYAGSRTPDVPTLQAITQAHAQTIPFENISVLLGQGVSLQLPAIVDKLVGQQRGGYCFEQNGLLLEVLRALGFKARPLPARVRLSTPDRSQLPRRTHMFIEVRVDGMHWLTDVGVGSATLTGALRLVPDVVQKTPHDQRRLQQDGARWFHQIWRGGRWQDVYEFRREDFALVDREVANWYTSTNPDSHFCTELTVALARPDGVRATLRNAEFTLYAADGTRQEQSARNTAELGALLAQQLGIILTAAPLQQLAHKIGLPACAA